MAIREEVKNGKKFFMVHVKLRDQAGKQHYRSKHGIKGEREAQRVEFELKKGLEAELNAGPIVYWGDWLEGCIEKMRLEMSASTCINYQSQLSKWVNPVFGRRALSEITKSDVHKLVFELIGDSEMSPNTRKTILKMVRRIFQMAVEDGVIDRNPCAGISVRVPEVDQKVFTNEEVGLFLREAKICDHRFYPIWVMALMTGMRSGEMFALEWSDIDLEARTIRVNKQWTNKCGFSPTKTRRNRIVPINEELLRFLRDWKMKADPDRNFVLPHLKEWEDGEQAQVTRDFCKAIGITQVKFHDLRATFITNLLARGVSLARVMSMVGHSQIKTTNGYLRKAGVDVQGATDQLGYSVPSESEARVFRLSLVGDS